MATYSAFSHAEQQRGSAASGHVAGASNGTDAASTTGVPSPESSAAQSTAPYSATSHRELLLGTRLEEAAALEKISEHTRRMAEMEDWFVSVKAEAAAERQMREQARVVVPSTWH